MEPVIDHVYQAMFTTTKNGYNPREVDRFLEQLKDELRLWNERYRLLEQEVQTLRAQQEGV